MIALLLMAVMHGQAIAQAPRLSISQVGLHFICTGDGQPDMYSWRMPEKDNSEGAQAGDYLIPAFNPTDINASSGGRTALKVDESEIQVFKIRHAYATGFDGWAARLTNLRQVHWIGQFEPYEGQVKERYYSNYPPLSDLQQPGKYGTLAVDYPVGHPQYGKYYLRHPGYDPVNWNWSLPYDQPLQINEKRLQAMLHLELRLPEGGSADADLNYSFVISGEDMSSIQVNGQRVFSSHSPIVVKTQKSLFLTNPSTELHTFGDLRRLVQGRRAPGKGNKPADVGYSESPNSTSMSSNLDLVSGFFTVQDHGDLTSDSGLIRIKIYDKHVAANTTEVPVQTVEFRLPTASAPSPDLVVTGSGQVSYTTPSGSQYHHPAVQAPRWWSFSRDGSVGRFDSFGLPVDLPASREFNAVKGRFFEWSGVSISSDRVAVNSLIPSTFNQQKIPGARALIYGYDASFYPDVEQVSVADLLMDPSRRIEYQAPDYDRPVHYGTDTLRVLKNIQPLVARTHVSEDEFQPEANYTSLNLHMAGGFAEEQPRIAVHPVSAVLVMGGQVRMSVGVGNGPVTYQWRFKGEPIPGATASSYLVADMSPAKAGAYEVVATNGKGSTTSKPAMLNLPGPVITAQPADILASEGEEALFAVTVEGEGPSYQWRRNGLVIAKATAATLLLKRVKLADEGRYDVVVTDANGTVVSEAAELGLRRTLAIVQQPVGGNLRTGGSLVLQVHTVGEGTLSYVWRRDGQVVAGADEDRLVLTATMENNRAGSYEVVVSDGSRSVTSQKVKVTAVGMPPAITQHPGDQTAGLGGQATFSVQAEGGNLTYQWRLNGANVARANGASLVVRGVKEKNFGRYDCVVENIHGRTLSQSAILSLSTDLSFTSLPEDLTVAPGEEAAFISLAEGEGLEPVYQWSFEGKAIPGAIYPELVMPKADMIQAGLYSVTASSGTNVVTATAMLWVREPGVLVYKLSGTGVTTTGATGTRMALKGFLIVNRSAEPPEGAMLLVSKDGRYSRYQVQSLNGLRVDSTGPALKTQTAISAITDVTEVPPFRSQLWLQGADSVVKLSKTDETLAPKTLSGSAHQLLIEDGTAQVTLETVSFKAALDLASTALARQNGESLSDATERLKVDLQVQGGLEAPEVEE